MDYQNEQQVIKDADGHVRVIHPIQQFEYYLLAAYNEIIDCAKDSPSVLEHIDRRLDDIDFIARNQNHKSSIQKLNKRVRNLHSKLVD